MTTEQMVRKCFYKGLKYRINFNMPFRNATTIPVSTEVYRLLARASRRFVAMEQTEKRKRLIEKLKRYKRKSKHATVFGGTK